MWIKIIGFLPGSVSVPVPNVAVTSGATTADEY